ncbi:MAG: hypothetical protein JO165_04755, partial [Candidatus Eremiobacteraeota bacterium]|nr:hypothetical protein [Candidatus Eremiobacteraeota bacterium]
AAGVTRTQGYSIATLTQIVATNAQVIAYGYLFRLSAIVFFVCTPLVLLMRASRESGAPPQVAAMAAD